MFLPQLVVVECIDHKEKRLHLDAATSASVEKKCMTSDDLTKTSLIVMLRAVHVQTLYTLSLVLRYCLS